MKKLLLPILLLGVVAGAVMYFWTQSRGGAEAAATVPGMPAATGATGAAAGKKTARVIPEVLPDFTLATLEGPPRTLSSYQHPSLIVNFWATWCAPCRREIPLLRQLRAERGARGVEVLGIAVDFREDVEKYVAKIGLDYPLMIGEEDGLAAADAFGIDPAFPFTVFADAQRRIVAVKVGELHADESAYILDHIERVNAGTLELALAREQIRAEIRRLDGLRAKS